jgi:hypothetical protein
MGGHDLKYDAHGSRCRGICFAKLPCVIRVGHIGDALDSSLNDLTRFITRTTMDPISGGGFGDVWKCGYDKDDVSTSVSPCIGFIDHAINLHRLIHKVAVKAFKFAVDCDLESMTRVSHDKYGDQTKSRIIWHFGS